MTIGPTKPDGGVDPLSPSVSSHDLLSTPEAGSVTIRGGTLRLIGFAVNTLLATIAAAFLFRYLGVVDVAHYVTVQSLVLILGGISDLGLTAIGVRELSVREGRSRRRFLSNLLGARLIVNVVGLTAIVAFTAISGYESRLVLGVLLAGIGLVIQTLSDTFQAALMSRLRFGWSTVAELVRQSVNTILIFVLIAVGAGLIPFLAATIPAAFSALVLTGILVRHDVPLLPTFDLAELRPLVVAVIPYSAAVAAATVYFRLSVVLVSLSVDAHQAGYFSVSFRVIETLVTVAVQMTGSAFPIFSRAAHQDSVRLAYAVQRVFLVMVIVGAGVAVAVILGAPFAIAVIGGAEFAPASDILQIQAIGLGLTFVGAVWMQAMLSMGLMRDILRVNLGLLFLGGALVALMVTIDGVTGAAIATSASELILTVTLIAVVRRRSPLIHPQWHSLVPVIWACALGLSPLLIPNIPSVVRMLLGGALYMTVILGTRALPEEVYVELRRLRLRLPRA